MMLFLELINHLHRIYVWRLNVEQVFNHFVVPLSFIFLSLQSLCEQLTCPVALAKLIPQLYHLVLFLLSLYYLLSLLLQVGGKLVEHTLQKLAAKQPFASPTSRQGHLLEVKTIRCNVVHCKMHIFIVVFFIEEPLVQSFSKSIKGFVRVFGTANQILALFDSCLLDRRVDFDVHYWKISFKGLVESFSPHADADQIIAVTPFIIGSYLHCSHFPILGTYNLYFDILVNALIDYLKGRLIERHFGVGRQFIQYLSG